jgi:medium-chain acyl-[acyl-carrier-protein] hydrolase
MTTAPSLDPWIRGLAPNPRAKLRLFCFHYAGGNASVFRTWPNALPVEIEVCAVQLPGRENRLREPTFTRLPNLIQALTPALRPYMTMPFAFFGHSLGALIAFELTRQLRREEQPGPLHLFLSSHRAAQLPDPDPPIHQLPEAEFIDKLRELNGTPEEVLRSVELMQLLLPCLRADFAVYETYAYASDAPLDCPFSVFGGLQDKEISRDDLLPWREQTTSTCNLRMFPGDHFYLHQTQPLLLKAIYQDLLPALSRIAINPR